MGRKKIKITHAVSSEAGNNCEKEKKTVTQTLSEYTRNASVYDLPMRTAYIRHGKKNGRRIAQPRLLGVTPSRWAP